MTDKELLEKAARAAGIDVWTDCDGNYYTGLLREGVEYENPWNPLNYDGDSLRLAVKLQISVLQNIVRVEASTIKLTLARVFIHEDTISQDCRIATRRAIVRAAAALGDQS